MDPFAALLAKQNPSEVEDEADSDPFNALLKRGAKPAPASKPGEIPTRAPGQPPGPTGGPPQPEAPEPSTLGRLIRGKGWLELGADAADIVVGGIPALAIGSYADLDQRIQALIKGQGWRAGGKAGAEASRAIGEAIGRPVYDNLVAAGLIDKNNRSIPMQAMDKVGSFLERSAETFERDTGMPKEDYLSLTNGFMAAMGVKGAGALVKHGVQVPGVPSARIKGLDQRVAEGQKSAWDAALERYNAEEQLAKARADEAAASATRRPVDLATTLNKAGLRERARDAYENPGPADKRTQKQRRADARAAFTTPEAQDLIAREDLGRARQAELDAQAAARLEQERAAIPGAPTAMWDPPVYAPRTGLREAQPIEVKNPLYDRTPDGQLFPVEDPMQTSRGTRLAPDAPLSEAHRLTLPATSTLDSGLAKVREGRLFDMTAEERLAVRGSREITDPKVITAAAVGATGLGLAMLYEPSPEEAAMAIGAGALLRRGGKGETLREIMAYPDATPLGAMLEPSAYTTRTIERLADASPGKFEFKKAQVEQLLKQSDVTAHERGVMREALDSVPGETITAKQLMVGMRTAVKDFELEPAKTARYADYGLDRIGREGLNPDLAADLDLPAGGHGDLQPTTRIYRSPLELDSNNHFGDPNYFAHTRSFVEDGVRHVVELQSDLAQKSAKPLTPEVRSQLRLREEQIKTNLLQIETERIAEHVKLGERLSELQKKGLDATSNEWREEGRFYREKLNELDGRENDLKVVQAEVQAKLREANSAEARRPVAPMLKDWHKRLIREELADAARNLEGSVRFATADTVAKVEGWPKQIAWKEGAEIAVPGLKGVKTSGSRRGTHSDFISDGIVFVKDGRLFERGFDVDAFGRKIRNAEIYTDERMLQGADLRPLIEGETFRSEHQGIYDRYSRDVEKFLRQLGGKPYTDSAGHTWLEVPLGEQQKALPGGGARTQIGGVDPALLKGVAAVGGTAALAWMLSADKDKARHAGMAGVLIGLGMLLKSRVPAIAAMVQKTVDGIQAVGGNLSTDRALTEPLLRRLTEHARAELKGIHDAGRAVVSFLEIVSRLPASVQKDLNVALMNGSSSGIVAAVGKAATPGLLKEWNNVQAQLKKFGAELQSVGLLKELRPDYFPRIVKDLPGLLNAIGKDYAVPLQRALDAAEKKAGMPLDEAERAAIVNKFIEKNLRGQSGEGKASFFKRRTIDNVTIDLEPFYVEPLQALPLYIGSATRAIERARFFGKDAVRDPVTGKLDLSNSIGNVVAKEIDAGNLTPENYTRLTKLLETRFGPAYGAPDRPFQALGQFTNIALLGNVFSGMMNLADIGTIAAQHGVVPLAAALAAKVGKRQKITAADVGMAEHIMEEFVYGTREPVKMRVPLTERTMQISLAKALDKTFKYSGFKFFDQVMKEVALNAAFEKYSRLSRTRAGEARITRQYSDYFTSDMPQLLADLRAGARTKLTTELAFRELSDAQPVTKVEMPQFYLDHPNLRFGFALKSFMIKQINLLKRRGVREIERGNFREGVGFLTRYTLMAGAAGATMDWVVKSLLGRDADTDWSTIPFNALKNFGLSEYVIDKMRQGKGKEALLAFTTPPVDPIMKTLSADPEAVRYFPLVGRLFYDRVMDGAEKANAAKRLQEKKKKRDAERTPEERRDLEERAVERRKRLLEER